MVIVELKSGSSPVATAARLWDWQLG